MKFNVNAHVICTFELPGGQCEAQDYILGALRAVPLEGFNLDGCNIIMWVDPDSNRPRRYVANDGTECHRFTADFRASFSAAGDSKQDAHVLTTRTMNDALMVDEAQTRMVVQSVSVYACPEAE